MIEYIERNDLSRIQTQTLIYQCLKVLVDKVEPKEILINSLKNHRLKYNNTPLSEQPLFLDAFPKLTDKDFCTMTGRTMEELKADRLRIENEI